MVIGRVFRGVGRFVGRIHGRVFRALGSLPLVGGAFKALGKFSAAGLGLLSKLSPMAMLGLGSYDPASSFLGGMSQGISGELNSRPQSPSYNMGNSFNNMYGPPMYGGGYGGYGGGYGMPQPAFQGRYGNHSGYGMPPFSQYGGANPCYCSCGVRHF